MRLNDNYGGGFLLKHPFVAMGIHLATWLGAREEDPNHIGNNFHLKKCYDHILKLKEKNENILRLTNIC